MPTPPFVTVPTKTVVQIDLDALTKMVCAGPILLALSDHNAMKALYIYAKKHGVGLLTMRTIALMQDGLLSPAYLVSMKPMADPNNKPKIGRPKIDRTQPLTQGHTTTITSYINSPHTC